MKRGLTHAEAIAYVGVKRRTFDEAWRPRLIAMPQGSCLIYDIKDLDRLFDEMKLEAAGADAAANDAAHNGPRNGRPATQIGDQQWAKQPGASTPTKTVPGKSTSGSGVLDFDSAVSQVFRKRNGG